MLEAIAKKFYPTKEEVAYVQNIASEIKNKLKVGRHVIVGGSIAKGTFIRGKHDIDFFVLFGKEEDMVELHPALKKIFRNVIIIKGSREYYNVKYKNYNLEFVPIIEIGKPEQAKNITDFSPFHVKFVNENLNENQKKDVVLLKQFCKSAGIYGAETHTKGFSGYSLELLIAYFGSFMKALENIAYSVPPLSIFFTKTKLHNIATLTVMDPVQPRRNVSAALSGKNFSIFQFSAKQLLRDADLNRNLLKYFVEEKDKLAKMKKMSRLRGTIFIAESVPIAEDKKKQLGILTGKLSSIASRIKSEGISLYDYGIIEEKNKAVVYLEFETLKLSKYKRHYGPPVHIGKKHFDEFMKKWENRVYTCDNHLCADVPRKYASIREFANKLLKELKIQ